MLDLPHDETFMFDAGYPLLRAYPALDIVCLLLPRSHPWHHRVGRALADLGVQPESGATVCVQRVDDAEPWDLRNVRVVDVPDELRRFHAIEHDDWMQQHGGSAR